MPTYLFAKLNLFFFAACGSWQDVKGGKFFFLQPWWRYLPVKTDQLGNCVPAITMPYTDSSGSHAGNFWLIGLAVVDDLLRVAGFVAVLSIILAGIQLVMSEGNPEKATNARNRLINSLIGLAIAFSAVALVSLVSNTITAGTTSSGLPQVDASNNSVIQNILNVVFAIAGALAFFYIVLSGFRYVVSGDNPTKVAEARRQIIYAALGLLVISLAGTIANYIINHLKKG